MVIALAQAHLNNWSDWVADFDSYFQPYLLDGLGQLSRGMGLTANAPLDNLNVATCYALVRLLGFNVFQQRATLSKCGLWFDDTLWCENHNGPVFAIYSRIATEKMERFLGGLTPEGLAP